MDVFLAFLRDIGLLNPEAFGTSNAQGLEFTSGD